MQFLIALARLPRSNYLTGRYVPTACLLAGLMLSGGCSAIVTGVVVAAGQRIARDAADEGVSTMERTVVDAAQRGGAARDTLSKSAGVNDRRVEVTPLRTNGKVQPVADTKQTETLPPPHLEPTAEDETTADAQPDVSPAPMVNGEEEPLLDPSTNP